jgi:hypothetical protein
MNGMLNYDTLSSGNLLDYHIALDYLETMNNYVVDKFRYYFNKNTSTLKLNPTPINNGYLLLQSEIYTGAFEDD